MLSARVHVGGRVFRTLKKAGVLSLANARVSGGNENTRIMYNSAVQHSLLGLHVDELKERSNNLLGVLYLLYFS